MPFDFEQCLRGQAGTLIKALAASAAPVPAE